MFFSIVIPTFNRERAVAKAIQSVLSQTLIDYEIIVVDDGSSDNTESVVRNFKSPVIKYFKTENFGVAHARNYGILKAEGLYVGFLDSDDLMETEHLQTAFGFIQSKNKANIVHLNFLYGTENRRITHKNKLPKKLPHDIFNSCSLHVNCVFIKAELAKNNLFNESRDLMFAEDWDFFIKLSVRYPIYLLDKATVYLTDHDDRSMRNFDELLWVKKRDAIVLSLLQDIEIQKNYRNKITNVSAHMNSLIAINLSIVKQRGKCLSYWILSIKQNFFEVFTRRSLAILKHLILP